MSSIPGAAQQVSHWLHDEHTCVTVQRIVQTFNLSWPASTSLLKGIPKEGHQYALIHYASTSALGASGSHDAFRLVKSPLSAATKSDDSSSWYALALDGCSESIHTAKAKDESQFRDEIERFSGPSSLHPYDKSEQDDDLEGFASSIVVSETMTQRLAGMGKRKADDAFDDPAIVSKGGSGRFAPQKKTATSARNFFASRSGGSGNWVSKTNAQPRHTTGSSKGKVAMSKAKQSFSVNPKKSDGTQSASKGSNLNADEEKENVQNKSRVGDADKIVFDEESSDEELEEAPAKEPTQTKQKEVAKEELVSVQDQQEEPQKVTKLLNSSNSGQKRRRKRMVDKTYTDENGYLYTETKAVWEDVPSSEDEKEPPTNNQRQTNKSKKSSSQPKAMKQGSLLGFFARKK